MFPAITHIDYYIPKKDYSNRKLINKKSIESIIKKVGIDNKFAASEDEFATDLAINAAKNLFLKNPKLKEKIDFIIYCTQSSENLIPSGSSKIQNEIFENKNIGSVDISLGCSGFVYSLAIAESFILSGFAKNIMIVTADTYSKFINEENLSVRTIFGDAATVSIISSISNKKNIIYKPDYGTDGNGIYDLILPGSGLKNIDQINKEALELGLKHSMKENELHMDGPKMFTFALKSVPSTIKKALKSNKLRISEIDLFILHQANKFMLESIRKKLGINENKLYISLNNRGNTTSSSIPLALYDAIKSKVVKKDMRVLLCGFGVGLSWATSIIKINSRLINNVLKK